MNPLHTRTYKSIADRGLITNDTTDEEFLKKAKEELLECQDELIFEHGNLDEEITDLMNVCINWIIHRGCDPDDELLKVIEKNEKRQVTKT
jgi:hypothetical protein